MSRACPSAVGGPPVLSPWSAFALAVALALGVGCGSTPRPRTNAPTAAAEPASPLGPSFVLLPVPSDDEALLGRILSAPPEPGRDLDAVSSPNPCADKLAPASSAAMQNTFEDAKELSVGARARAVLGMFGLNAEAQHATHFFYRVTTERRAARTDTAEYAACCKEKGCGYGYVSALVYGSGEYASGQEGSASAGVDVAVVSGQGTTALKILQKKKVKGWLAAVVKVTDANAGAKLGTLGSAQAVADKDLELPAQVQALYEGNKITLARNGAEADDYVFQDGRGKALTENDFVARFRDATGSRELDDVEGRRNWASVIVWGSITGLSTAAILAGTVFAPKECEHERYTTDRGTECLREGRETNVPLLGVGAVGGLVGGYFLVRALFNHDGGTGDHRLTEYDARLYAARHNRALFKKAVRDVERNNAEPGARAEPPPWRVEPVLGLPYLGLRGSF
jgi:hypothetical protein